jgi:hypothetical protein
MEKDATGSPRAEEHRYKPNLASRLPNPETGQDFGARAKAAAAELAFGKVVTVRLLGTDRYRRSVALVVLPDGRLLNHELVRSGFAWWFRRYAPADVALQRLEAETREAKRGLWSQPNPIPLGLAASHRATCRTGDRCHRQSPEPRLPPPYLPERGADGRKEPRRLRLGSGRRRCRLPPRQGLPQGLTTAEGARLRPHAGIP